MVNPAPPRVAFLTGYTNLLARADVRRLVASAMIARLPGAMLPLAILLLVHGKTGSLAAAGLVVGAYGVGRAAASPIVGAMIDRLGQFAVLVPGVAAQAVLLAVLVVVIELGLAIPLVAALAAVAGASVPPIQASLRALWPVIATGDAARDAAYAFDATSQELMWIAGPLVVAGLLSVSTPAAIVIISAAIGCAGVGLFATSPLSRAWQGARSSSRVRFGALSGGNLRAVVLTALFSGFAWGAMTFGLTALAVGLGSSRASGLLLAALSAGSIAGGLAYGARAWPGSTIARYRMLLGATAICVLPLVLVRSIGIALPLSVLAGLPLAASYAALYVLTGRSARQGTMTEAFTWTSSAFALGVSLGTAGAGTSGQVVGVQSAFAMACLAAVAAMMLAFLVRDREPTG
jgi:hypothetical protein